MPDPNWNDDSPDEWTLEYDHAFGSHFDSSSEGDALSTVGHVLDRAEARPGAGKRARGQLLDSTGAAWDWDVEPRGSIVLVEVRGGRRLTITDDAVAER